jgi:hypothetical protein
MPATMKLDEILTVWEVFNHTKDDHLLSHTDGVSSFEWRFLYGLHLFVGDTLLPPLDKLEEI